MKAFTVEWVYKNGLHDSNLNASTNAPSMVPVVRLAEVDKVIGEAVWAMEQISHIESFFDNKSSAAYKRAQAFLASQVVKEWEKRQKKEPVAADLKQTVRRSCNLHQDCDVADREGKKQHCRVEDCEDCYGQ